MKPGRPRIWVLGGVFAAVACVVVVQLFLLMIEQGPTWVERSYRNRWGFRDVPTRRGTILDREGRVVAEDEPAFDLVLHYRLFRRDHALGVAVHGANLVVQARGYGDDFFGFEGRDRGPLQALDAMLDMPGSWLRAGAVADDTARDLSFYVSSLVAATTGRSRTQVYREMRRVEVSDGVKLREALGEAVVARMRAGFVRRLEEFDRISAWLAGLGHARTLWDVVEGRRRVHGWRDTEAEHVARTVYRGVDYQLAARVHLLGERHPGLTVRPSVGRSKGRLRGRDDLASLEPLIGGVTPYWVEDKEGLADTVSEVLSHEVLSDLVPLDPDLPEDLAARLHADARRSVTTHLLTHGRIGRWGLERDLDPQLAGRPGLRLVIKDRHAVERGQWSSLDTSPGHDLQLTVDLELQELLEEILDRHWRDDDSARELAIAIVEPSTGDILAMGGRPLGTKDRPKYTTPAATWGGVGYVGSIAKPFVALEQLDAVRKGRTSRHHSGFRACTGTFPVAGLPRGLGCNGHGAASSDVGFAIAKSCNFFFYQAARGLGAAGLSRAFGRAGWTVGEAGEDARYQRVVLGVNGIGAATVAARGVALERMAIGYGVQASALQVARAYAGLATGELPEIGLVVSPHRLHRAVPLEVHPDDLTQVRDGLRRCVTDGTARGVEGLRSWGVLAKTGTAEISTVTHHNNAWLAGYLTAKHPSLAFAAVAYDVPDLSHGADVAGALVAEFLRELHADAELRVRFLPGVTGR